MVCEKFQEADDGTRRQEQKLASDRSLHGSSTETQGKGGEREAARRLLLAGNCQVDAGSTLNSWVTSIS